MCSAMMLAHIVLATNVYMACMLLHVQEPLLCCVDAEMFDWKGGGGGD